MNKYNNTIYNDCLFVKDELIYINEQLDSYEIYCDNQTEFFKHNLRRFETSFISKIRYEICEDINYLYRFEKQLIYWISYFDFLKQQDQETIDSSIYMILFGNYINLNEALKKTNQYLVQVKEILNILNEYLKYKI